VEAMTMGDRIVVLNKGDIQQVDTPLNIYRKPANRFVAGFMGSPPMNFVAVQFDHHGNLIGESLIKAIALPDISLDQINSDRGLVIGFRPEDLHPATADDADFVGVVELVEALGSETIVLLKSGDTEIRARVSADIGLQQHWQSGDRSFWRFDRNRIYIFDAISGITLHCPFN
jgi:multiple sugar transport system ATP-binding protein